MNKINYWHQGYFVDQRKYERWSQREKQRANYQESHLVRTNGTDNAICTCNDPSDAKWIAQRLNFAANIEIRLGHICNMIIGGQA